MCSSSFGVTLLFWAIAVGIALAAGMIPLAVTGSGIVNADSSDKIWILLDGVSLRCEDIRCIAIKLHRRVAITAFNQGLVRD